MPQEGSQILSGQSQVEHRECEQTVNPHGAQDDHYVHQQLTHCCPHVTGSQNEANSDGEKSQRRAPAIARE